MKEEVVLRFGLSQNNIDGTLFKVSFRKIRGTSSIRGKYGSVKGKIPLDQTFSKISRRERNLNFLSS